MSEILGISKIMSQIMVNRGIRTKNTAIKYLNPKLQFLRNTLEIKDLEKAIEIVSKFVLSGEKIAIYGDYDVDGVVSTSILYKTLVKCNSNVIYYIPNREHEGYGLNINAVKKLYDEGVKLIITCDNGIASIQEINYAKQLKMTVVVIDHHEPPYIKDESSNLQEAVSNADAIVNPKQKECAYPFKMLCAGGLAFKFAIAFSEYLKVQVNINEFIVLAMLATLCDVVDLQDENRIIVKNGLYILNKNKHINLGLHALIKKCGYADKEINDFCVGFSLGPCINATGRLESASLAVELLITNDKKRAETLAGYLQKLNEERKLLTTQSTESALKALSTQDVLPIAVIYDKTMHESIAGIVAGRIKERIYQPTFVLTNSSDSKFVKGSGRSIESYNMFLELSKCKELLERFGGHEMAAGLTLKRENIELLRQSLNKNCTLEYEDFIETIKIDGQLSIADATFALAEELQKMAPFGKGNRQPLFLTKNLKVIEVKVIGNKNTIIFMFYDEISRRKIKGVCFEMADAFLEKLEETFSEFECEKIMIGMLRDIKLYMDVVYYIDINEFKGDVSVQLKVKDYIIH